ncbi:MAG: OmpA family protein [Spirochaetes bacterium]|nr:OmpA family protein [Spirochaetota bacterium]
MNKTKKIAAVLMSLALGVFAMQCSSAPATPNVAAAPGGDMLVNSLNGQLDQATLSGFDVWGTQVDTSKYDSWAQVSAPIVKGMLDQTPDGYNLEVQGHADGDGGAAANQRVSTQRAKIIYDALRKQGVNSPKLTYKGYGATRLKNASDKSAAENRRVGFQVVKK